MTDTAIGTYACDHDGDCIGAHCARCHAPLCEQCPSCDCPGSKCICDMEN